MGYEGQALFRRPSVGLERALGTHPREARLAHVPTRLVRQRALCRAVQHPLHLHSTELLALPCPKA